MILSLSSLTHKLCLAKPSSTRSRVGLPTTGARSLWTEVPEPQDARAFLCGCPKPSRSWRRERSELSPLCLQRALSQAVESPCTPVLSRTTVQDSHMGAIPRAPQPLLCSAPSFQPLPWEPHPSASPELTGPPPQLGEPRGGPQVPGPEQGPLPASARCSHLETHRFASFFLLLLASGGNASTALDGYRQNTCAPNKFVTPPRRG